jgi:hypothetical protein
MKKLLLFLVMIAQGVYAQTFFYYSSTPDSQVGLGKTEFVTNGPAFDFSGISWSYDEDHTVFGIGIGFTRRSTEERHVANFSIPYPTGDISEAIFSFSGKSMDTMFGDTPAMGFTRYKYDSTGVGYEYRIDPVVSSSVFVIHSLVFGDGGITGGVVMSAAIDFVQVHGNSLEGFTRDYGIIRYNSDFPVYEFPVAAIPEPSTYAALFGIGLFGFAVFKRVSLK